MDNHAGKSTDLAWIAGIIEGEGYLGIANMSGRKTLQYYPRIQIYNTDLTLIEAVSDVLEFHAIPHYVRKNTDNRSQYHKNRSMHTISITGISRVKKALDLTLPFMRGEKAARAKVVLAFVESRLGKANVPYSEQEHEMYREFRRLVESPRDYTLNPL
jgi:hypothetical protein